MRSTEDPVGPGPTDQPPEIEDPDCVPAARIVVNELSSSNTGLVRDAWGDSPDWLELYNAGAVPVDLADWALSDDGDDPRKWVFPPVTLEPGAFQLVYASDAAERTLVVGRWDTRVEEGDDWRYLEVGDGPAAADWFAPGFDDSGWPVGPSGFGYGDGDDATDLEAATVYARVQVELTAAELTDLVGLYLHVDYDDAFVAYLNGVEVARADIGLPGTPPGWDERAPSEHEGRLYLGETPPLFDLGAATALLVPGANTLAVEVHDTADSSDLTLVPFLSLGFASPGAGSPAPELALSTVELHTNFSLKARGERVRLFDPAGCEADDVQPGQLFADQSYGHQPDGDGAPGYFMEPTPRAANLTESRPGFAATPTFDPPPGHVPGGADVSVLAGAGAEVHVAFEGWEPTEADPTYTAPLPTGSDGEAVVIRARAWEAGLWPSRVATGTWFLREPGNVPLVSVVTDPPNLWDEDVGIYAFGPDFDPVPPYVGANFLRRGWERPVHLAEWEPDGAMGFSVDAGVAIHGGYSRRYEQKSFLVELGSGYGDDTIEHDVFPGLGITSFERLLLRNAGNDWHGCYANGCPHGAHFRDALMARLPAGEDLDVMASRPAELYLNGEYWGVYLMNERPDASYIAGHHGQEDIDLLDENADPVEGDPNHYLATLAFLRSSDLGDPTVYAQVGTMIDLDELMAYLAFEVFYGNVDWPNHNIKFWRPRAADGRWRWMLYDTDAGLGQWGDSASEDSLARALADDGVENPEWATELFRLLVRSPEFSASFVNGYADYLNTLLVPDVTRAAMRELEAELAPVMPRQLDRWGTWTDGVTEHVMPAGEWQEQVEWIDRWLGQRPDYAREHVVANFGLEGTWTLELSADPPGSGTFALSTVEVDGPFTGVYFRGVPVTITANPAPGYTFAGWSDPALGAAASVTLDPDGPVALVARFD